MYNLNMTHNQFKKADRLISSIMAGILFLLLFSLLVGCEHTFVTEKEVIYKKVYFADTNGVTTTIYYPKSMEKDLRTPHDNERWKYVTAKNAPDDGKPKQMVVRKP